MITLKVTRMGGNRGYFVGSLYVNDTLLRDYSGFAHPDDTDADLLMRCEQALVKELGVPVQIDLP